MKIESSNSVIFEISEREVGGKTNRFGELQIYSILRAQSSVDFENTRWKCATYGVKWEAERCLFRRNLQPIDDEHAQTSVATVCKFVSLPDPNVFYSFEANTSKFALARQARKHNTMHANKLMGAHEFQDGDMLQGYNHAVSVLPNFNNSLVVSDFYVRIV